MPSDEYTSAAAGGALRIKGAKVKKHKKKKAGKSDLEKNLSTGESEPSRRRDREDAAGDIKRDDDHHHRAVKKEEEEEEEEKDREEGAGAGPSTKSRKTETERRFEEARRKKLLELSEQASSRPGLLKTHRERVEELNTYLSKLSEHHDMPKIGPG